MYRHGVLRRVDNWKFWVGVAYFGLCAIVVALWVLFGRTAQEDAARTAQARSTAVQEVSTCFTSVSNAPVVDGFVEALRLVVNNSILSTQALIKIDEGLRLNDARRASLVRLRVASEHVKDVDKLIKAATPTKESCVKLADKLQVPSQKFLQELDKKRERGGKR